MAIIEVFFQLVMEVTQQNLPLHLTLLKAYVRGYEIDNIATSFVPVEKARDFDTENNTRQDMI